MNTLRAIAICAVVSLSCLHSEAQEKLPLNQTNLNKPKVFEDLPRKMNLIVSDLEILFELSVGSPVTAKLGPDFHFKGTVVSRSGDAASQVRSVVINATARKGAVFTFTRIRKEDGDLIYRGRILNRESIDAYEIVKENDQYVLEKKNYHEMVTE